MTTTTARRYAALCRSIWLAAALACATVTFVPAIACAAYRPGGGQSYSSSSSHSSSSSSSSSHYSSSSGGSHGSIGFGELVAACVMIGIFLLIVSVVNRNKTPDAGTESEGVTAPDRQHIRQQLEQIKAQDPNFSTVLFEDFMYALYAQAYTLRGGGALERLSAYLSPSAKDTLVSLGNVREVRSIIVGAMSYLAVESDREDGSGTAIAVELETNYSEISSDGVERCYYSHEAWALTRKRGVLSRTPERARVFNCPSCGAPLESMTGGQCQYCRTTVNTGQFDWVVGEIEVGSRELRGPLLTGTTEERGTDSPTIIDPELGTRYPELCARDPSFAWPALQARIVVIFNAMQASWSNRDWTQARPFVSDNLFQMLAYWIEAYKREKLRNVTEGAEVERIEIARVSSDKFYDAITVRLFASSLDYTIADADGKVVGGNRNQRRRYSEYWTLIRSAGKKGVASAALACPSCGAPLQIEMAGHCQHCHAKVTAGDFDWVLSRIEQDDSYAG